MKNVVLHHIQFFFMVGIMWCATASAQTVSEYKNVGGIYQEVRSDTTNPCRYTEDNQIYRAGNEYTFAFRYFNPQGQERFMRVYKEAVRKPEINERGDTSYYTALYGRYILADAFDEDSCIQQYIMRINPSNTGYGFSPDYDQTVEVFEFWLKDGARPFAQSASGIVENERNIWMHPNRTLLLEVLELNPFPYVKFPAKEGLKWKWKLTIGSQWGSPYWKEWEGAIVNRYRYKIVDTSCSLSTALGALDCVRVEATAKSRLGKTHLTAYYNEKYGFVKFDYINIDGSQIEIDLQSLRSVFTH